MIPTDTEADLSVSDNSTETDRTYFTPCDPWSNVPVPGVQRYAIRYGPCQGQAQPAHCMSSLEQVLATARGGSISRLCFIGYRGVQCQIPYDYIK